jgi:saccharopepsin
VYDFGDFDSEGKMGNPYMKLLPIIDANEASVDFHKLRGGTPKTNITYKGLDGISVMPSFNISDDISESLERIGRYLPAMLAVVALNALILIILAVAGLVICYRRRNPVAPARTIRGRMSPMPMNPRGNFSGLPGAQSQGYQPVHSMAISDYQPVHSMAISEDTMFVPPSPAFHSDGNTLRPGDRPKSVA